MQITLKPEQVRAALGSPALEKGLRRYLAIQEYAGRREPLAGNRDFQRQFNGFYRVRRNEVWQRCFYELLDRARINRMTFSEVLRRLHEGTGQYEASFASKLVATVDPNYPVIDQYVLACVGARLPYYIVRDRLDRIERIHSELADCFAAYLRSEDGRLLVQEFERAYPGCGISQTKMLDLVLWQSR